MKRVSQHRGLFSVLRSSVELWAKGPYGFGEVGRKTADQVGCCVRSAAVMNLPALGLGAHCRPDLLMRNPFPDFPGLAQEADFSCRSDPPNKMKAASGDWQVFRKRMDLLPGQSRLACGAVGMRGSLPFESRWVIWRHVPGPKLGATGDNGPQRTKTIPIPETARPQTVAPCHHPIACGFGRGNEDQLNAQVHTPADKGAKAAGSALSPRARDVIVEVQAIGHSQDLPGVPHVLVKGRSRFVGGNRLRKRSRPDSHRVKGKDLLTSVESARRPIHGVQNIIGGDTGRWIEGGGGRRRGRGEPPGSAQPPIDGSHRRDTGEQLLLPYLLVDCWCTKESQAALVHSASEAKDESPRLEWIGVRRPFGLLGVVFQPWPARAGKTLEPAKPPGATAWNPSEDLNRVLSQSW
jgi:hypothetical protein